MSPFKKSNLRYNKTKANLKGGDDWLDQSNYGRTNISTY